MSDQPRYNHGQVIIELGGRDYTLSPTMEACDKIDAEFGGIVPALNKVRQMNGGAISRIVCIGIGVPSKGGEQTIRQAVFDKGYAEVGPAVVDYLTALLRPSGKPEDETESGGDQGN